MWRICTEVCAETVNSECVGRGLSAGRQRNRHRGKTEARDKAAVSYGHQHLCGTSAFRTAMMSKAVGTWVGRAVLTLIVVLIQYDANSSTT